MKREKGDTKLSRLYRPDVVGGDANRESKAVVGVTANNFFNRRIYISEKGNVLNLIRLVALSVIAVLAMGSCQKIIHVDLNTSNPQLVIEAYVTDQPLIDTVLILKTGSYFTPGNYPRVNGATIVVTDNTGVIDTFLQVDSGTYATQHLTGVPGRTYTLKAFVAGKEYDAVSTMQQPVNIDSITSNLVGKATDTGYHIRCHFLDPAATTNYYRVQAFYNGVLQDSADNITLDQDKYTNGLPQSIRLKVPYAYTGDTVKVNLLSIDYNTYDYFSVISSITAASNPISTATPQNPPTNILGGALGYFSAYSVRSQSIIIP